ncbi:MAG: hypothetical protein R3C44_25240, partial [Chloroflexota bacterium]
DQEPRYLFGDMCTRDLYAMQDNGQEWETTYLGKIDGDRATLTFGQSLTNDVYVGQGVEDGPIYQIVLP